MNTWVAIAGNNYMDMVPVDEIDSHWLDDTSDACDCRPLITFDDTLENGKVWHREWKTLLFLWEEV